MKLFSVSSDLQVMEGINSEDIELSLCGTMLKLLAPVGLTIRTADVIGDKLSCEHHTHDRRAMVFVHCPHYLELELAANTVTEELDKWGNVARVPRPFGDALGVQTIQLNRSGIIVSMLPRASFRVSYVGCRPKGVPPYAVILWSGRYDHNNPTAGLRAFPRAFG